MLSQRLSAGFVAVIILLASSPSNVRAQFPTAGAAGATGTNGAATSAAGVTAGLLNQTTPFPGFSKSFGSNNGPFALGTTSLTGGANTIGSLAGATSTAAGGVGQAGAGGIGGLGGATGGLGGVGGGLGGGAGGLGGGLGGIGGGLGGIGGGLGGIGGGRGGFGGQGGFGGGGFGGGGFGQNQFGGNNRAGGQQQTRNSIKTVYKPAFEPTENTLPALTDVQKTTEIQARMLRMPLPEKYRTVQIEVAGRKAILMGEVNSEADARFVARLIGLEAGIDSVESRLTLRSAFRETVPAVPKL